MKWLIFGTIGFAFCVCFVLIVRQCIKYYYYQGMKAGMQIEAGIRKGENIGNLNKLYNRYER